MAQDDNDHTKYICGKLSPKKTEIDEEVDTALSDLKKKGKDYRKEGLPVADNCPGYPVLLHKQQGFDVDRKKP